MVTDVSCGPNITSALDAIKQNLARGTNRWLFRRYLSFVLEYFPHFIIGHAFNGSKHNEYRVRWLYLHISIIGVNPIDPWTSCQW